MIYISVDCETSGVNPEKDQILSIGLVIEDTVNMKPISELPKLHLVIVRDRLEGNVFALDMNSDIIKLLKNYQTSTTEEEKESLEKSFGCKFVEEYNVVEEIFDFLFINGVVDNNFIFDFFGGYMKVINECGVPILNNHTPITKLTIGGKNVGTFDKLFLEKLPRWNDVFKIHQRVIDPAISFVDWSKDEVLPNLNECMKRAGVDGEVTHNALSDAIDVIKVLRSTYENK